MGTQLAVLVYDAMETAVGLTAVSLAVVSVFFGTYFLQNVLINALQQSHLQPMFHPNWYLSIIEHDKDRVAHYDLE